MLCKDTYLYLDLYLYLYLYLFLYRQRLVVKCRRSVRCFSLAVSYVLSYPALVYVVCCLAVFLFVCFHSRSLALRSQSTRGTVKQAPSQ